jgi:Tfp pilus assembly protein PilN
MSRVNLLPSDIKRGQQVRRRTFLVIVGGAVVIGLIVLMWIYQGVRLSGVNDDIQAQNRTNAGLQQEINDLQKYEDLQVEAQQQQELLTAAYANEVAFSGVLVDVSKVIPPDMYLTSYNATVDTTAVPSTETTTTPDTTTFVGTMAFSGSTLHFDSLSIWLTRLEEVEGWANPWTSNISQDSAVLGAYAFDTTVDLTQDALTQRGRGGVAAGG